VQRRSRAGQVVNFIDFQINWIGDVVADQFKARMAQQVGNVVFAPGEKVVQAEDVVSLSEQAFTQVRA
jgi:hypothetical protein